jgi:hypothetical protein
VDDLTRRPSSDTHVLSARSTVMYVDGKRTNSKPGGPACRPPTLAALSSFLAFTSYARPYSVARAGVSRVRVG